MSNHLDWLSNNYCMLYPIPALSLSLCPHFLFSVDSYKCYCCCFLVFRSHLLGCWFSQLYTVQTSTNPIKYYMVYVYIYYVSLYVYLYMSNPTTFSLFVSNAIALFCVVPYVFTHPSLLFTHVFLLLLSSVSPLSLYLSISRWRRSLFIHAQRFHGNIKNVCFQQYIRSYSDQCIHIHIILSCKRVLCLLRFVSRYTMKQ